MTIIGIGPGEVDLLSRRARQRIEQAEIIIGSPRLIGLFPDKPSRAAVRTDEVVELVRQYPGAAVLMSGDSGFFSGAKGVLKAFPKAEVIPGISSLSYFCARLGRSYDDIAWLSLHGRSGNITAKLLEHGSLFVLTDETNTPAAIAKQLPPDIRRATRVSVGANLSQADEVIDILPAEEVTGRQYAPLCVALFDYAGPAVPKLLRDDEMLRGKSPMTKEEVRAIALLKLAPRAGETIIDVGSGTGSVSFALARLGVSVKAIEHDPAAWEIFQSNLTRLGGDVVLYRGQASQLIPQLPRAEAAFIGGSGGELSDILQQLRANNPAMRLVIAAITLETLSQVMALSQQGEIELTDVTAVQISQAKELGAYHLMMAKNPVYLMEVRFG